MRADFSDWLLAAAAACARGIVYVSLLLPVVIVAGASLTDTDTLRFPPQGFTLAWYWRAFESAPFMESMRLSVVLGVVATVLALVLGGAAAFAIARYEFRGRGLFAALALSPIVMPAVVLGLGLLQLLAWAGLGRSPAGLLLGHVVIAIPYVVRIVSSSLLLLDCTLEEAAMSLRATPRRVLWRITLPLLAPALLSAAVFAFVASFGNITLSVFLGFSGSVTLPVRIYAYIENQYDPMLAAMSVVVIAITLAVILAVEWLTGMERAL